MIEATLEILARLQIVAAPLLLMAAGYLGYLASKGSGSGRK